MKKFYLVFAASLIFGGCDSIYQYLFIPEERIEYTIIPDAEAMETLNDTSYYISRDGLGVGYDAKDWKIEIRYMSDYQLNTFEFPDESDDGEFSTNPFTYGNWVDPKLGYSPRKFSVFKVSIFNYTGSKINYDPEISTLQSDRGDFFHAYAREQKNAKFHSIEEYYNMRKGSSGVEEDIFESRMGIARRQMLYYGKPIYKGDSREGLVVFDPLVETIEGIKLTVEDFVLEYDENNDAAEFKDLLFYFRQVPAKDVAVSPEAVADGDSIAAKKTVRIAQLKYVNDATKSDERLFQTFTVNNIWDPSPEGIASMLDYAEENSNYKLSFNTVDLKTQDISNYDMLMITGIGTNPQIPETDKLASFIRNGGIIFIDISKFKAVGGADVGEEILKSIARDVEEGAIVKQVNIDHPIFIQPNKLSVLPEGFSSLNTNIEESFSITGVFVEGKLTAVSVSKSYPMLWKESGHKQALDFGLNIINYAAQN